MQKLKLKLIIASSIILGLISFSPVLVLADCANLQTAQEQVQCGASSAAGNTGTSDASKTLGDTVASIINLLSAAVGVIAVIMIIISGLRYATSGGNAEAAKSAKNTITYAIIGLVIVAFAQIIVHFVLYRIDSPTAPTSNTTTPPPTGGHI